MTFGNLSCVQFEIVYTEFLKIICFFLRGEGPIGDGHFKLANRVTLVVSNRFPTS